jgi:tRNA U34 5-methylaminomethyl-2-thiouridine-forming methyltransferase MnmC
MRLCRGIDPETVMSALKIITTADGSHSLLNEAMQETYHSVHGAIQESEHVFINCGLQYWVERMRSSSLRILEIGFGTGLNAWLTMQYARRHKLSIAYVSIEAYPLEEGIWSVLNYATDDDQNAFLNLHRASWGTLVDIQPGFMLTKLHSRLEDTLLDDASFDLIYFDAFAPSKQPEMWTLPVLERIVKSMRTDGVFVTYCAKGQVKRDLRMLNMITESLPGPPGKKEMIRAMKSDR